MDRNAEIASFPPFVVSVVNTTAGDVLVTGGALLPAGAERLQASANGGVNLPVTWDMGPPDASGHRDTRFYVIAPKEILHHRLVVTAYRETGAVGDPIDIQIDRVDPSRSALPVIGGISEYKVR